MRTPEILGLIEEFFTTYSIDKATPETRNDVIDRCQNLVTEEAEEVLEAHAAYNAAPGPETRAHFGQELGDVRYVTGYTRHALSLPPRHAAAFYLDLPPTFHSADLWGGIRQLSERTANYFAALKQSEPGSEQEEQARQALAVMLERIDVKINAVASHNGIPLEKVIRIVHAANLDKVWPDGTIHRREDGKILKPPGWEDPKTRIADALAA
ncbi:hypothetical protein ACIBCT_35070 [Streptosporangium sp. NPDC050855]|uniref:hypothetical protein n=1 Tax=Streptosporangium sp. NPDC050855 TaxID=3366194 RepID=UPI0037B146F2